MDAFLEGDSWSTPGDFVHVDSPCSPESDVFLSDRVEKFIPRFDERLGALALETGGKLIVVDPGFGELGDHLFGIGAIAGQ
jgi:hypothetical protein